MPRIKNLKPQDYADSDSLLSAFFADPTRGDLNIIDRFERDQRESIYEDNMLVEAKYDMPDRWEYVELNLKQLRKVQKSPGYFIRKMDFGTKLNMSGTAVDRDLLPVVLDVYAMIIMASPRRSGFYRRNHEIYIDGRPVSTGTGTVNVTRDSYAQIANRVEYASTLEVNEPHWPKPYQKALRKAIRKYGKDWDLRLEFGSPGGSLGGTIYKSAERLRSPNKGPYNYPVLTIAPLNSLPYTGFVWKRRRTRRERKSANIRR